MPKILTPARLTAAAGVCTGLAGVAGALTGVVDVHSSVGQAIVAAAGYLTTGVSIFKFLEGQSKWETQQAGLEHDRVLFAQHNEAPDAKGAEPFVEDSPETEPIGEAIEPEPARLADQATS